jgi:hypothetical protein
VVELAGYLQTVACVGCFPTHGPAEPKPETHAFVRYVNVTYRRAGEDLCKVCGKPASDPVHESARPTETPKRRTVLGLVPYCHDCDIRHEDGEGPCATEPQEPGEEA